MIPYIKQIISQSRAVAHKDVTKLCITKRPFWTMVLKSAFFGRFDAKVKMLLQDPLLF